ncbi:hypothetical protein BC629DRAFT_1724416 [Irpex lacteus]|nr:hypothetical protein BC629DRAFT_1724416 [Irpex lacteus]
MLKVGEVGRGRVATNTLREVLVGEGTIETVHHTCERVVVGIDGAHWGQIILEPFSASEKRSVLVGKSWECLGDAVPAQVMNEGMGVGEEAAEEERMYRVKPAGSSGYGGQVFPMRVSRPSGSTSNSQHGLKGHDGAVNKPYLSSQVLDEDDGGESELRRWDCRRGEPTPLRLGGCTSCGTLASGKADLTATRSLYALIGRDTVFSYVYIHIGLRHDASFTRYPCGPFGHSRLASQVR